MAKKQFFLILDTETTIKDTVADFAMVVCDRHGVIHNQMAVLIRGEFDKHDLFYDKNAVGLWSKEYAAQKKLMYLEYLNSGVRQLASVNAINLWIAKAIGQYNPTLTAYNLAFDKSKCKNTGIDLSGFKDEFCLWGASVGNICDSKAFKAFVMQNHAFNNVTKFANMTFKTNAEVVASFLAGKMLEENHDALGDIVDFELPIFRAILKKSKWRDKITSYDWNKFQVKNHFVAK